MYSLHVVWALGEMDAEEADRALRQHLKIETSKRVADEIKAVLQTRQS